VQDELVYDVLQIGYGPVSQVLALMLARQGHRVAVVERWSEPFALPRAVCIDHEAARILHALGLEEGLARVSRPAPRYEWFNAEWETLLSIDWSAASVSGGPEVNFVHQPSLEAEFRAAVRGQPGAALHLGWELVGFTDHGDHVAVEVREVEGGATRTLRTRYLVGADGANSPVRETLGIASEDRGFHADWLVVDMLLHPGVVLDIPACGQYCNPARPTTIVPGGVPAGAAEGRVCRRWEFMRLPHESREALQDEATVWGLLEPWVKREQAELIRHTIYTFRSLIADRWRQGRVLLVGDAVHVMPPFMGQGMCAGIRDAWNLSWKLDALLRGAADDTLLDSYATERKPHVSAVIDASIYLGKVICIADPAQAAERDQAFKAGTHAPLPAFPHLTTGILARDADGTPAPVAGLLSPHGLVRWRGREGRWDDVVGLGFCVIARDANPSDLLRPDQLRALAQLGAQVIGIAAAPHGDLVVDLEGRYAAFLDAHGAAAMITRPDFYIFGSVPEVRDLTALVDILIESLADNGFRVSAEAEFEGEHRQARSEMGGAAGQASPVRRPNHLVHTIGVASAAAPHSAAKL
jgi:2-polyprenyl-6-methoxyphenol hydroxylase-like FAD-dependent oxidoreductase